MPRSPKKYTIQDKKSVLLSACSRRGYACSKTMTKKDLLRLIHPPKSRSPKRVMIPNVPLFTGPNIRSKQSGTLFSTESNKSSTGFAPTKSSPNLLDGPIPTNLPTGLLDKPNPALVNTLNQAKELTKDATKAKTDEIVVDDLNMASAKIRDATLLVQTPADVKAIEIASDTIMQNTEKVKENHKGVLNIIGIGTSVLNAASSLASTVTSIVSAGMSALSPSKDDPPTIPKIIVSDTDEKRSNPTIKIVDEEEDNDVFYDASETPLSFNFAKRYRRIVSRRVY